jgi:hypothetical protein
MQLYRRAGRNRARKAAAMKNAPHSNREQGLRGPATGLEPVTPL